MQRAWDVWKKSFSIWEDATSRLADAALRSPLLLEPAAGTLGVAARLRAAAADGAHAFWRSFGLPTRRDQERTLFALNDLQSRLLDLEERLGAPKES